MILLGSFRSVQYLHMPMNGVTPMPPASIATLSYSPSKVNCPYGASMAAQSLSLSALRAVEYSLSESFLVNSKWSISVGLLEKLK